MKEFNVKKIIFSSSATVYGVPVNLPITEHHTVDPKNPYGQSKFMVEKMLSSLYGSDNSWSIEILRYFNPVGAHPSGLLGEKPIGAPNNLMPLINLVAAKKIEFLNIYGNDYSTIDGTGVRDYIHVTDLAKGHVNALFHVLKNTGIRIFNLGTGAGYSVLEVIKTFETVNKCLVPYKFFGRRLGDVESAVADPSLAIKTLNWKCEKNLKDMCSDSWNWFKEI